MNIIKNNVFKRILLLVTVLVIVIGGGAYTLNLSHSHNPTHVSRAVANGSSAVLIRKMRKPTEKIIKNTNCREKPSTIIATALYNSDYGKSALYKNSNNLFGIKGAYHGKSITFNTVNDKNGHSTFKATKFAKYPNLAQSIKAYVNIINEHKRLPHLNIKPIVKKYNLTSYDNF